MPLEILLKEGTDYKFLFWPSNQEKTDAIRAARSNTSKRAATQSYFSSPDVYTFYYRTWDYVSTKDFSVDGAFSYIDVLQDPAKSPIANAVYPNNESMIFDFIDEINARTVENPTAPLSQGNINPETPPVGSPAVNAAIDVQDKINSVKSTLDKIGATIQSLKTPTLIIAGIAVALWAGDKLFFSGIRKYSEYKGALKKVRE